MSRNVWGNMAQVHVTYPNYLHTQNVVPFIISAWTQAFIPRHSFPSSASLLPGAYNGMDFPPCCCSPRTNNQVGRERRTFIVQATSRCVCQVLGETPRPTPCPPLVQAVLILFHLPTAWVAALYQVVGGKVHTINLRRQSLHLLVQDVKPERTQGVVNSSRSAGVQCSLLSRCAALASSL